MENKKISFGFSKIAKKSTGIPQPPKNVKTELIDCLESSEIKVKNPVVKVEKKPLVIAIKGNPNNLLSRIQTEASKNKDKKVDENEDTRPDSELTIEELAARQLIQEARQKLAQKKDTTKVHTLPLVDESVTSLDAEESTMDDYENIPINDYGMALLRGMGWKEGMCIGKNQSKSVKPPDPELRPKGLGLGAQKMVQEETEVLDKNGKQLILAKGAFAKITAGHHKGTFCEVQGLDDEAGRVIVKCSRSGDVLTLNELFVKPVTKEEYALGSKVINNAKYEQYKENEMKGSSKSEKSSRHRQVKEERDSSDEYRSSKKRDSKHKIKEDADDSTDEYRRSRYSEENRSRNKKKSKSKSRHRSRDKTYYDKKRSSSESSSEQRSRSSKHTRRRSEDSDDKHKHRSKSNKHRNRDKSRTSGNKNKKYRSDSSSDD